MMPPDALFRRQLTVEARYVLNSELLDHLDTLALADDADDGSPGAAVERVRNAQRREVLTAELHRRMAAARPGGPTPTADRYEAWAAVARECRERIDLPWLFDSLGYQLRPAGKNSRRNDAEWCGACPLCGGHDRLRVFSGPNGRAWCRRCGWSADAILVARSLDPRLTGFYRAVTFLAGILGIPLPDESLPTSPAATTPVAVITLPSGVTFTPLRHGGRHGR